MPWTNHDRVPASRLAPVLYCRISKNKVQPLNGVCAPRAFVFVDGNNHTYVRSCASRSSRFPVIYITDDYKQRG